MEFSLPKANIMQPHLIITHQRDKLINAINSLNQVQSVALRRRFELQIVELKGD
jgi:hypothetical protein